MNDFIEKAKVLKILILLKRDKFPILHMFKTFWTFIIWLRKFFSFSGFLSWVTYSKYFDDIIIEINTFHTTEWQFYPFNQTNPCNFAFYLINFKTGKNSKRIKCFYDFCCGIYNFYQKVVSSVYTLYRKAYIQAFNIIICLNQNRSYF